VRDQDGTAITDDSTVCIEIVLNLYRGSGLANTTGNVRNLTEALAEPLSAEDQTVQSMPECQPDQVASGAHNVVLRTFVLVPHARAIASSMRRLASSSIPTTNRRASLSAAVAWRAQSAWR